MLDPRRKRSRPSGLVRCSDGREERMRQDLCVRPDEKIVGIRTVAAAATNTRLVPNTKVGICDYYNGADDDCN